MSAALATRVGFKFALTVKEGPDKGVAFQLLPPKVTIGRGSDCHVMLTDPRMSRQAASIDFSMEQIIIKDLSSKNVLSVNGKTGREFSLKNGDQIGIGDTQMAFMVEALPLNQALNQTPARMAPGTMLSPVSNAPPPAMLPPPSQFQSAFSSPHGSGEMRSPAKTADSGSQMRIILIGIIVLGGLFWAFKAKITAHKVDSGLRTTEVVEKEITSSESRVEELMRHRRFANPEEETRFNEAHHHYQEGFRDYQHHQFQRAIKSFETALAIDPSHELAGRYLKLAEAERDQMVADLTLEGRSYKDKHMFTRCSAAFVKVLDVIADKNDLKYKQADALKNECDLMSSEKYR
jgi:hypothetical protein